MSVPSCGCRMRGNQHGSWMDLCEDHYGLISAAAGLLGTSPEEFLNRVIVEYAEQHSQTESAG